MIYLEFELNRLAVVQGLRRLSVPPMLDRTRRIKQPRFRNATDELRSLRTLF